MLRGRKNIYRAYFFIDALIILVAFFVPYILRYKSQLDLVDLRLPYAKEYAVIYFLWIVLIVSFFRARGLYSTDRNLTIPKEILKIISALILPSIIIAGIIFFLQFKSYSRLVFIENFLFLFVGFSLWRAIKRLIIRDLIKKGHYNINTLIIGAGNIGKLIIKEIEKQPFLGIRIRGFLDDNKTGTVSNIPILGKLAEFVDICKRNFIDEVFITIPSERQQVARIIQESKKMHLGLRIVPEKFEDSLMEVTVANLGMMPILTYKERSLHKTELLLKRFFDFTISLIFVILLAPVFLLISLVIKLDSSGPVLYLQKRVGRKGRIFNMYKFRSMVKDADKLKASLENKNEVRGGVIFKVKSDPRVTRFGKFLRRHSLDELPQFFNVLFGDMSLIGPRPPLMSEVKQYDLWHMDRLFIRPGMTGLSQIRGRSELSFHRWVRWDVWYMNNWSFWLDLSILWNTIPTVLKGKGAY